MLFVNGIEDELPCGNYDHFAGMYCTSNQAIYINLDVHESDYNADDWLTYSIETTLSHEMAHHVQARTGILWASWWYQSTLSGDAALLENRRLELQAQCFHGLAFNALAIGLGVTAADRDFFWRYEHRWADSTHGTSEHQAEWFWTGLNNMDRIGPACNTYIVEAGWLD